MPGVPWTTFLLVITYSPRYLPTISALISRGTNSLPLWTPMVSPTMVGRTIMSLAWVLISPSFFPSRLALASSRSFLFSSETPLLSDLLALDGRSWSSASVDMALSSSMVFPLYLNSFGIYYETSALDLANLFLPVFLGAINPTFLPGGAFLEVLVDFPGCWCLPPPNGW